MNETIPVAEFAPAERVPIQIIHRQAAALRESALSAQLLHCGLNFVFILNQQRQIVFASQNCELLLPGQSAGKLLGLRLGEALGCLHATESEGGCGTTEFCQECGAAKAILASLGGAKDIQEWRMTRLISLAPKALDLMVCAIPFSHKGERFSIFSVQDISHEKRRRTLERALFQEVINQAKGLKGLASTLTQAAAPKLRKELVSLQKGLHNLLETASAQRDLTAAEADQLAAAPSLLETSEVLKQVIELYQNHDLAKDRGLVPAPRSATLPFTSDPTLLKRVLGNLVKNALEATPKGLKVTVGCEARDKQIRFWVHNPTTMSPSVRRQIFNRSFSTKGTGRGLGTYSVKLWTEKYLDGAASFTTSPEHGTTFYVTLPADLGAASAARGGRLAGRRPETKSAARI